MGDAEKKRTARLLFEFSGFMRRFLVVRVGEEEQGRFMYDTGYCCCIGLLNEGKITWINTFLKIITDFSNFFCLLPFIAIL